MLLMSMRRWRVVLGLAAAAMGSMAFGPCERFGLGSPLFHFRAPLYGQLSLQGPLDFELRTPRVAVPGSLQVRVDGQLLDASGLTESERLASGRIEGLDEGVHHLVARVRIPLFFFQFDLFAATSFELVALDRPEICEVLNDAECLLPYPSSRFLEAADTPTGVRVAFPDDAMPPIVGGPNLLEFLAGARYKLDPTPYNRLDGFSPSVQILMHFPGAADLEASGAARLLEDTRNFDLRSLDPDSPTLLIDAETLEPVAHFVENDARANGPFAPRQMTYLRPATSLLPGRRYIVAVRDLVHADGSPVEAEPGFAVLRDGRPTDIRALEARRSHAEEIFKLLRRAGVRRERLILAFDFVTQSREGLTGEMLSMRDAAFVWLAAQDPADLFEVTSVEEVTPEAECRLDELWRMVRGSFRVPLFLTTDPVAQPNQIGVLNVDPGSGALVQNGFTSVPFGIAIPCATVLGGAVHPLVFGHGLFGSGPDSVRELGGLIPELLLQLRNEGILPEDVRFDYLAGATNWSGLSSLEVPPLPSEIPDNVDDILNDPVLLQQIIALLNSFIGKLFLDFDNFPALPDRLRQGQLHTLVLARMMKTGVFNVHPAFQTSEGFPAFQADAEMFYFGASLGGIMGLMFTALTPDIERANVDVPAINFSLLLQRAKPFKGLQAFLDVIEPDPTTQGLTIQLIHELWVKGESAGYAHHITGNTLAPLEGPVFATNPKQILMTVALYDQQVSTLAAQIAAATLGLPNLQGSVLTELPLVPDIGDRVGSAHVVYDTGSYQLGVDDAFIPPLANLTAAVDDNRCDPHGLRGLIPASLQQLVAFLRPGGRIENFCRGRCDAEPGLRLEIPFGDTLACDPNAAP